MTKKDKLLNRVLVVDKNLNYEQLKTFLESYGFIEQSCTGSHHVFSKLGTRNIVLVSNTKAIPVYIVKQIMEWFINEYGI